jgi:hypothetical protein
MTARYGGTTHMDMNITTNPSKAKGNGKPIGTTLAIQYTTISNDVTTAAQQRVSANKPIPSRVDYNFFNYCSHCDLKLPKYVLRCTECKQKVRTKPWHRSKIIQFKRI